MSARLVYLPEWRVLVCEECGFGLRPGRGVWVRHLRQAPHCLKGPELRAQVELFERYDLCAPEQELAQLPAHAIPGLRLLDGFQCLTCAAGLTQSLQAIERHVSKAHQLKPAWHKKNPLWRSCKLQTVFAENRLVRYFVVEDEGRAEDQGAPDTGARIAWVQGTKTSFSCSTRTPLLQRRMLRQRPTSFMASMVTDPLWCRG